MVPKHPSPICLVRRWWRHYAIFRKKSTTSHQITDFHGAIVPSLLKIWELLLKFHVRCGDVQPKQPIVRNTPIPKCVIAIRNEDLTGFHNDCSWCFRFRDCFFMVFLHLSQTTSNSCLPKELRSNLNHGISWETTDQNPALTFLLNCAAVQRRRVIAQAAAAGSKVPHGYNFTSSDQSSTSQRSTSPEKGCNLQNLRWNLYEPKL